MKVVAADSHNMVAARMENRLPKVQGITDVKKLVLSHNTVVVQMEKHHLEEQIKKVGFDEVSFTLYK